MSDEDLKFVRIGGPGLSDAAYSLPKSSLGRQAPLRTASTRIASRGVKPSVELPKSGMGMPYLTNRPKSKG
jgi:hypothetical protein